MSDKPPAYWAKYPCDKCGTGYGFCLQGWSRNLMCCAGCNHPQNRTWTAEDRAEMEQERNRG